MGTNVRERRRALFYTGESDGLYDVTISLVVPGYRRIHAVLLDLLRDHLSPPERFEGTVLDIGSGTGMQTLAILRAFPRAHVVAIDLSARMHGILRTKLRGRPHLERRCTLVVGDIAGPECSVAALRSTVQTPRGAPRGFSAVVSAFAIHHLESREKRAVARRVHSVLLDGGLFLNADLFSYRDPRLARLALNHELDWIARRLGGTRHSHLVGPWHTHYKRDNRCEPIEDAPSLDRRGSVGSVASTLTAAGFQNIAVPYRLWQTGIVQARK